MFTSARSCVPFAALAVALPLLASSSSAADIADAPHPPIPVRFTLKDPGFVTLVIDDAAGNRVRNLVSETPFPAGANTAWWDGLDDLGRDTNAASHGIYHVPGRMVAPGSYRVRGLVRPKLDIVYRMTPYSHGNPPWATPDKSSEWLANHTPPSTVLFIPAGQAPVRDGKPSSSGPQMLVASKVSEGGSGLAWLDMNGNKLNGQMWIGGIWTGATHLARDTGDHPVAGQYAYAGSAWPGDKYNGNVGELRLNALVATRGKAPKDARLGSGEDKPVLAENWRYPDNGAAGLGGLAVRNGILIASLPRLNQLLFVDCATQKTIGTAPLDNPGGLAFDSQGGLIALSGKKLLRFASATSPTTLPSPQTLVAGGLEEPQQIALDPAGNIYVSDWGHCNQVKVFTATGKALRTIGTAGVPAVGVYDPTQMHSPNGMSVDADGRLWVAETDKAPKRISVWTTSGKFVTAYYGPHQYGGGGILDPLDKTRYFYADEGGIELKVDWQTGTAAPVAVYYRPELDVLHLGGGWSHSPETPVHANGRTYLTDSFTVSPTGGASSAAVFLLDKGVARPVAAVGQANDWRLFGVNGRYSMRWSGFLTAKYSETYTLTTWAADGVRVIVDGKPIIERWKSGLSTDTGTVDLVAGKRTPIRVEYYNKGGSGGIKLSWQSTSQKREIIPATQLSTTAAGTPEGLNGEYFADNELAALKATQVDPVLNFDWGTNVPAVLADPGVAEMRKRLPVGATFPTDRVWFTWVDRNADGQVQPDEVTTATGDTLSVNVMPDLSIVTGTGLLLKPQGFTPGGAPIYDAAKATVFVPDTQRPTTSGGGQAIVDAAGNFVLTVAPKPYAPQGIGGGKGGVATWSYPSAWPGLHASHNAAMPQFPGQLIGTTRLLGNTVKPVASDAGEIFALNGNKGTVYLFTTDGLFVATLFKDSRTASWNAPAATPGMSVANLSLMEESFWPSISQTSDGHIYLEGNGSLLEVEGLDGVRRLPTSPLTVSSAQLQAAQSYFVESEAARQASAASTTLTVKLRADAPTVDGKLDDWQGASWVTIDTRVTQVGDWGHRTAKTLAAMSVAGDQLYVALQTDDPALLNNSGEALRNLFKTGGAIDLMIGSNSNADPKRTKPVAGDSRLLVARVKGKTTAVLYRQVGGNTGGTAADFASPMRSVHFDSVQDISDQVKLASGLVEDLKARTTVQIFEFSVPLAALGVVPADGATIKGDIGVLRGNGYQTLQRAYWTNKASGLVSDLPSEAELMPQLWGSLAFVK
ncbi:MAG TPA: PA14 domain-containing protein [Capsulimonadaceae bacterium]|jgi:hypothetical protein